MPEVVLKISEEEITRFYGGSRPTDIPLYSIAAASRYVGAPVSTVRWWIRGRLEAGYAPVIREGGGNLLTFNDLTELFVIRQLRQVHGISLQNIRRAVDYASRELGVKRVLLSTDLRTFGDSVLLRHLGSVIAISKGGQVALEEIIELTMRRIVRSADSTPASLFPLFYGESEVDGRPPVSVSQLIAFGRPTVTGTSLRTSVVATIADSGVKLPEIAEDYDLPVEAIRNAVLFENAA